jgi:hypothetical protein
MARGFPLAVPMPPLDSSEQSGNWIDVLDRFAPTRQGMVDISHRQSK